MKREQIRDIIDKELEKLRNILESAPEKFTEIIEEFTNETPRVLQIIKNNLTQNQFALAAASIHKIKVRYSYIGFDNIYEKLSSWEDHLKRNEIIPSIHAEFAEIIKYTNEIIVELDNYNKYTERDNLTSDRLPLIGKKVLVAEDDEINAMVFEAFILELGGEIVVAHDGFEAISIASQNAPDLIFMDVHMPYCSGLDAIKTLRSRGINTPIISLSASSGLNERDDSLQAGANDFLTKPANRLSIKQALLKHIR